MTLRTPPSTASQAQPQAGGKLFAPSSERNMAPLCDLIRHANPQGNAALELASGTGQHVIAFATEFPHFHWQPTEPDAERRTSIAQYRAESSLTNIAPPLSLNATTPGWSADHAPKDLIVLVNLLHLISMDEVHTLIHEASRCLALGGTFIVYGPFMRGGELTSGGDASFHASLTAHDPEIGYKDDFDIMDILQDAGLEMRAVVDMPANNLGLIAGKPEI